MEPIQMAILRGVVEGRLEKYLGATDGIGFWLKDLQNRGYVYGPATITEGGERKCKWMPTDAGLELYRQAGLDQLPQGRWYFHEERYRCP